MTCRVYAFQSSSTCSPQSDIHKAMPPDGGVQSCLGYISFEIFQRPMKAAWGSLSCRLKPTGLVSPQVWLFQPRMQLQWVTNRWSKNTAMTSPCCQLVQDPDYQRSNPNTGEFPISTYILLSRKKSKPWSWWFNEPFQRPWSYFSYPYPHLY